MGMVFRDDHYHEGTLRKDSEDSNKTPTKKEEVKIVHGRTFRKKWGSWYLSG